MLDHHDRVDFNSLAPSILTRNGDAALVNGLLRLTPDAFNQNGSAFLNTPFEFNTETSFSTRFEFQIHAQGGISAGDGLVFIIQNDPRGSTALGTGGSGLGYGNAGLFGGPPIANSIGIAFDTSSLLMIELNRGSRPFSRRVSHGPNFAWVEIVEGDTAASLFRLKDALVMHRSNMAGTVTKVETGHRCAGLFDVPERFCSLVFAPIITMPLLERRS